MIADFKGMVKDWVMMARENIEKIGGTRKREDRMAQTSTADGGGVAFGGKEPRMGFRQSGKEGR